MAFLVLTMQLYSLCSHSILLNCVLLIVFCIITYKRANFNYNEFVLDHVPWNTIDFDYDDIETSWALWKDFFFSVIVLTINSQVQVKWKQRKIKHCFSSDTTVEPL